MINWLVVSLVGWSVVLFWLVGWLVDSLAFSLIFSLASLTGPLVDLLVR